MRQPLPHSGFRWLVREEIDALDLSTVGAEDKIGYILDIDLGYPPRLHDLYSCSYTHLTTTLHGDTTQRFQ